MRDKILEVLENINPIIINYEGSTLLEDGIIDSFELIDIVSAIEDELKIEINAELVVAENFANKDTIVKMVEDIILHGI